jgi:hypothetical protein
MVRDQGYAHKAQHVLGTFGPAAKVEGANTRAEAVG